MSFRPTTLGARSGKRRALGLFTALAVVGAVPAAAAAAQHQPAKPAKPAVATHRPGAPAADPAIRNPPPTVRMTAPGLKLALVPYTACWHNQHSGYCYDGIPPTPRPSLGGVYGRITLAFPRDGWTFSVTAWDADGHHMRVPVVPTGEQSWRLVRSGLPNGHYRLDVFGRGPQGDVAVGAAVVLI